jgi:hypothetical protein
MDQRPAKQKADYGLHPSLHHPILRLQIRNKVVPYETDKTVLADRSPADRDTTHLHFQTTLGPEAWVLKMQETEPAQNLYRA